MTAIELKMSLLQEVMSLEDEHSKLLSHPSRLNPLTVEGKDAQVRRSAAVAADQDQRMVFGVMTRRAPT